MFFVNEITFCLYDYFFNRMKIDRLNRLLWLKTDEKALPGANGIWRKVLCPWKGRWPHKKCVDGRFYFSFIKITNYSFIDLNHFYKSKATYIFILIINIIFRDMLQV